MPVIIDLFALTSLHPLKSSLPLSNDHSQHLLWSRAVTPTTVTHICALLTHICALHYLTFSHQYGLPAHNSYTHDCIYYSRIFMLANYI